MVIAEKKYFLTTRNKEYFTIYGCHYSSSPVDIKIIQVDDIANIDVEQYKKKLSYKGIKNDIYFVLEPIDIDFEYVSLVGIDHEYDIFRGFILKKCVIKNKEIYKIKCEKEFGFFGNLKKYVLEIEKCLNNVFFYCVFDNTYQTDIPDQVISTRNYDLVCFLLQRGFEIVDRLDWEETHSTNTEETIDYTVYQKSCHRYTLVK